MNSSENTMWIFLKHIHRVSLTLALALIWQVIQLPLLGQLGSTVQNFTQVVLNDGSTTTFTIHNPGDVETIDVDVQLYLNNGDPLENRQVELAPGETESIVFGDPAATITTGWAELTSNEEFVATEFFELSVGGVVRPLVGVLPSVTSDQIRVVGFVNEQITSGLAIHNPSPTEQAQVTVRIRDTAGQQPANEKMVTLEPRQVLSGFLNGEIYFGSQLENFEGSVELVAASVPVAALSLIQDPTGNVATIAVEAATHIITTNSNTAIGRDALSSNTTGFQNTATGVFALSQNTEGNSNTATGVAALQVNTTGSNNTATGVAALRDNTTGNSNTANGFDALQANTTGNSNTATGSAALRANTIGTENTATGVAALRDNTTGNSNTANGSAALISNTTGSQNTAIGHNALRSNTMGEGNTAMGFEALRDNTEADFNTAIGAAALRENTIGNQNTATGAFALQFNTIGTDNTATGFEALQANTTGFQNTATGRSALRNNTEGFDNTATGLSALRANTTGERNTANGANALFFNTTGLENTAIGSAALLSNTTGVINTATGRSALRSNTTGDSNTASGVSALRDNTIGTNNTAIGVNALLFNTEGFNNTAIGRSALSGSQTSDNIAIGFAAGSFLITGRNNIYVGNPGAEESNTIRIGRDTHTSGFMAGVQLVAPSSRLFKQDIQDMDQASSDLMRLRPVTFRYREEHDPGNGRRQFGLIAEEVAQVYPELVVTDEGGQPKTVEYQKLPAMLLNELQKQQQTVQEQQAVIQGQASAIVELTERLSRLERVLTARQTAAN